MAPLSAAIFALIAVATAKNHSEEPAVVIGTSQAPSSEPALGAKLDVLSEKVDKLRLRGNGLPSPQTDPRKEEERHREAEDERHEMFEGIHELQKEEEEAQLKGKLEGAQLAAEQELANMAQTQAESMEAEAHVQNQLSNLEEAAAEDALDELEHEEDELAEADYDSENAGSRLAKTSDTKFKADHDKYLRQASTLLKETDFFNHEMDVEDAKETAAMAEEATMAVKNAESHAEKDDPEILEGEGTILEGEGTILEGEGIATIAPSTLAVGVADHPCPCIEQMMEDPCPPGDSGQCEGILAKMTAEERLRGDIETLKKTVRHKDWKGPPVIVKKQSTKPHTF